MDLFLTIVLIFWASFLYMLYYKKIYLFNKRLENFVSPPDTPLLGHLRDFESRDVLKVLTRYNQLYGENVMFKIGPSRTFFLTTNYNLVKFILKSNKIIEKPAEFNHLQRWLGTGLLTGTGKTWRKHRNTIAPTFHSRNLETFVNVFEKNGKILITKLEKVLTEDSVDIYPFATLCTLDVICECTMGASLNIQENSNSDYFGSIKDLYKIIFDRAFTFLKSFDFIYKLTDASKKEKEALKIIHNYSYNAIRKRQEDLQRREVKCAEIRRSFIDILLENNPDHHLLALTCEEIRSEMDTLVYSAHDTTASTISFALYSIANDLDIQAKIFQEQKEILRNDFDRAIRLEDLNKMEYLECVIKETLRLYPPLPFISRELNADLEFDKYSLPKGLILTIFILGIHRNPNYFKKPLIFDPSRFEDMDDIKPFSYLPFSAGPRNCVGEQFAMAEMKSIISRLVRSFVLHPAMPSHKLKLHSETVLVSKTGMCIRIRKREFS